jgi:phosphoserine phosphatase
MDLALFDLDNTLIAGDSDFEWAQFLIGKGILDRALYEAGTSNSTSSTRPARSTSTSSSISSCSRWRAIPRALLDAWHARVHGPDTSCRWSAAKARALVASTSTRRPVRHRHRHQQLRHRPDRPRVRHRAPDRHHSGAGERPVHRRPRGLPSFREGKIIRVEAWLEALGLWWSSFERSWFYSDSLNDLPLLSKVSDPVAVDPDPTLRAHAEAAGWPIISLLG